MARALIRHPSHASARGHSHTAKLKLKLTESSFQLQHHHQRFATRPEYVTRAALLLIMETEVPTGCDWEEFVRPSNDKSLQVQLVLSLVIGLGAFFTFCVLRPRWPGLYAARKRRRDRTSNLPTLSDSAFGWIPQLYRVTEEQVLASAGLDAFVFLAFFKMAIRLFAIMAFFATVVLWPINTSYRDFKFDFSGNHTQHIAGGTYVFDESGQIQFVTDFDPSTGEKGKKDKGIKYLWSYVVFTYLFVLLTIYFVNWETFRIIRYRQNYLGSQSTVTDRSFRLTGIPSDLRSEADIKSLIEKLKIGTVESVNLCRDWKHLDDLMALREKTLRILERCWAQHLNYRGASKRNVSAIYRGTPSSSDSRGLDTDEEFGEGGHLLDPDVDQADWGEQGTRPQVRLRYGFLGLRFRSVDAIDYYEEKLRRVDARVYEARKKTYRATDTAIVTMDSVASCQMLTQARIDPRPGRLLTKPTPAPSDLIWRNTYAPRGLRRLKSWAVTIFITILTMVWIFPTAGLASLMSICTIKRVLPQFAEWLQDHSIIHSLFQNGVPTLVVSLLNVAVPYLYDWLSNCQGMISQGDVELSLVSKNFFFTFFNTFFVFAVSRTGLDFWSVLSGFLKDTSQIPKAIAGDVDQLSVFYTSFIMLQGIGLMPFRILEVGSVFLYPFSRMMSRTPRDFSELKQPPIFQYGFYLPTALLVFNLCLIYSVLTQGFAILIVGTIYFALGHFAFKYMVLYAMDQPQHATGGAWRIICQRIIIGLVVFEIVMFGQIALLKAFLQSVVILPLLPFTIWYSYYIKQRFDPLTKYIALRAINMDEDSEEAISDEPSDEEGLRPSGRVLRRGSTLDEDREQGLRFVNPSLVEPLRQPWIYKDPPPVVPDDVTEASEDRNPPILSGADSSLGIGYANVWGDSGSETNV